MAFESHCGEKKWNFRIRTVLCQWSFSKFFKKLVLAEFFKYELLEKVSEPSRAKLFDQKLEPKLSQTEPSLGSGATLDYWQQNDLQNQLKLWKDAFPTIWVSLGQKYLIISRFKFDYVGMKASSNLQCKNKHLNLLELGHRSGAKMAGNRLKIDVLDANLL